MLVRTNVVLDDHLIEKALKTTGLKTRRELLDYALRELVRHSEQKKLLKLQGNITWEGNLNTSRLGRHSE